MPSWRCCATSDRGQLIPPASALRRAFVTIPSMTLAEHAEVVVGELGDDGQAVAEGAGTAAGWSRRAGSRW